MFAVSCECSLAGLFSVGTRISQEDKFPKLIVCVQFQSIYTFSNSTVHILRATSLPKTLFFDKLNFIKKFHSRFDF